ncbi:MAG: T9SS type A sorting domain-containing protein [Bacteroidota bacterium]
MKHLFQICIFFFLIFASSVMLGQKWIPQETILPNDSSIESQDHIGNAIAVTENYLLAGAHFHHYDSMGQDRIFNAGAAYMYRKTATGDWELHQKLVSENRKPTAFFGDKLAMSDQWVAIASPYAKVDSVVGSSQVGIVEMYQLTSAGFWQFDTTLLAPFPIFGGHFGSALALSGNRVLIGSDGDNYDENEADSIREAGATFVFEYEAGKGWEFVQKLVASDRQEEAHFGQVLALDGDRAVISAPHFDVENPFINFESGQAYIFERSPVSGVWEEVQILQDQLAESYEYYGRYPDISGDYVMIGNPTEDDLPGGERLTEAGSVEVYHRENSGEWVLHQVLVASDRAYKDHFGTVCLKGNVALIGALTEDHIGMNMDSLTSAGSVYAFDLQANGQWRESAKIVAPLRNQFDQFGYVMDLQGETLIVGVPFAAHDSVFYDAGLVYVFEREWPLAIDRQTVFSDLPIQLLHNPSAELSLRNQSGQPQTVDLQLLDLNGKQLIQKTVPIVDSWTQDFPSLAAGIYLVKWTHPDFGQHVQKWMKIER